MWCRPSLRGAALAAVAFSYLIFVAAGRAQAMVEFCPAMVDTWAPVGSAEAAAPRDVTDFTFRLSAFGGRTASATVAVNTDSGWYRIDVPAVPIYAHDETYRSRLQQGTATEFFSAPLQVRFATPVQVRQAFVIAAAAKYDGPFGWEARGQVSCDPVGPGFVRTTPPHSPGIRTITFSEKPTRVEKLVMLAPPARLETPQGLNCVRPFVEARAVGAVRPATLDSSEYIAGDALVMVALDARGVAVDAWTRVPSPSPAINMTAVEAAKATKYEPAIAFCRPVPSLYTYRYSVST